MKNLTTTLKTGDLRPKERVMLLVRNSVAEDTTGKEILTESDKHALSEGWQPRNNDEVHEYNRYNRGMNLIGSATIDAQTAFLNAQIAHYHKLHFVIKLLQYPQHREMQRWLKRLTKIKLVTAREAMEISEKQKAVKLENGVDFDYVVYQLAFESLSAEDKARMNELYQEVEVDHSYLDQEEVIANLLDDKGELSKKNKEKLATLVSEHCYNSFAKEYQLSHYFACIPVAEVARRFLVKNGIELGGKSLAQNQDCDDEDSVTHDTIQKAMETYAREHDIVIETILKKSCLEWIDSGLFDQYTPLALSNDTELFARWLEAKREAGTALRKKVSEGKLKIRERSPDELRRNKLYSKGLYDDELKNAQQALEVMGVQVHPSAKGEQDERVAFASFSDQIVTGDSLYGFESEWSFVKEFKEQVDRYDANLGLVYADGDHEQAGQHLDQEMLIASVDNNGELAFFSIFSLATRRLGLFLDNGMFFEETENNSNTFLAFKDRKFEQVFIESKNDLIEGYATILSFGEMFEKLSKIYDVDFSYKTKPWLDVLEEYIDYHNNAIDWAIGKKIADDDKKLFLHNKEILKIDDALCIDKENIKPDRERTKMYFEEFEKLFGSEFGSYE